MTNLQYIVKYHVWTDDFRDIGNYKKFHKIHSKVESREIVELPIIRSIIAHVLEVTSAK